MAEERLRNIAVRLAWVLLRASLQELYPFGERRSADAAQDEEFAAIMNVVNFRAALKSVARLPPARRFEAMNKMLPFLDTVGEECIKEIRSQLSGKVLCEVR